MAVMSRGANVPLTREIPGLRHIVVGVAWNAGAEPVLQDNLVMAAVLCDEANKAISAEHFVFFNQLTVARPVGDPAGEGAWPATRSRWRSTCPTCRPRCPASPSCST